MSLVVLSVGVLISGSPHRAPIERDAVFTESSFTASQSLGNAPPHPLPGSLEGDILSPEPSICLSKSLVK